jgi:hypothetical protein
MLSRISGMTRRVIIVISLFALTFVAGCNLPGAQPPTLATATLPLPSETPTVAATEPPAVTPSATLVPTETSAPTLQSPQILNDTLCYRGPGKVYGVVSSLKGGTNAVLMGKGSLPDWWVVLNPTYNQPCWIAAADLRVDPAYDATALQVYDVPPVPANLVPGKAALDPSNPSCSAEFTISVNVTNKGTEPTLTGGTVSAIDRRSADGSKQASVTGTFPVLKAGGIYRVAMKMTVSKWYNEDHEIQIVIDPNNDIPENNDKDNTVTLTYTLQKGSCP